MMWLLFFLLVATPIGILFAVLLDREIRGSRFYQSAFYLPVVLSLALIGFIWELLSRRRGSSTTSSGDQSGQRDQLAG